MRINDLKIKKRGRIALKKAPDYAIIFSCDIFRRNFSPEDGLYCPSRKICEHYPIRTVKYESKG